MTGDQLDKILGDWWRDHIANSPISRSTDAYNALVAKFDVLKRELHAALGGGKMTTRTVLTGDELLRLAGQN